MILSLNIYALVYKLRQRHVITIVAALLLTITVYANIQSVAYAAEMQPNQPDTVVTSLSAGQNHNCEIKSDNTVACWGLNDDGEASPLVGAFTQVAAGAFHTCALKNDGTVACWGDNSSLQSTPPSGTFSQITVGASHSCAIKNDGSGAVVCWGEDGDSQASPPSGNFKQINAGDAHNCGIQSDDTLACWGLNDNNQSSPPSGKFKQVSAGGSHTCALKSDNTVACWGNNDDNQSSPPAGAFTQVSAGSAHSCGLKNDGTVACWGDNSAGQASPPAGLFLQVDASDLHTCGVRSDGTVVCWGDNSYGQAPVIQLAPTTLPTGLLGVAYSQPITTSADSYRPTLSNLTLSSGLLPTGLSISSSPGNGIAGLLTGTPTAAGSFIFTLRSIDANGLGAEDTFSLRIDQAPVANNQNVTVQQNTARTIRLTASDSENDPLTYVIVSQPAHGTLTGLGSLKTFAPANNYSGADSFTFKVNDGAADSTIATVNITIPSTPPPANTAPVANPQNLTILRGTPSTIMLVATDADNNPLSYTVVNNPTHGTLSGTAPNLTYTPAAGYTGPDNFTFKANDGLADSNSAAINITILANNDTAPIANDQVVIGVNTGKAITLTASDSENDALTYIIISNPISGTLSGTPPHLIYTPNIRGVGVTIDSFTFKVNDGVADSNVAMVKITLLPAGVSATYSPVANSQNVVTTRNTARKITLAATDANNDALTYTLLTNPTHGTLSGIAPDLIYSPNPGFAAMDKFTFKVTNSRTDGNENSNEATVNIQVIASNTAPVADNQNVIVPQNTAQSILISASDDDNDPLTYSVNNPAHGTLIGTPPNLGYIPTAGYSGADSFTFKVNDGTADSNLATVNISIDTVAVTQSSNTAPIADNQDVITAQDTAKKITLTGSDADNNPLIYSQVTNPAHGALSGTLPNLTYTPSAGFSGDDSFTFKINDGQVDSNVATVRITVVPAPPAAGSVTGIVYHDKNLNGQKDNGEAGIANVTVVLTNAVGNEVTAASVAASNPERRTTTNADGVYLFEKIPAGNYIIKLELPATFALVGPTQFSITVGSTNQTTAPPFALKGYKILLPLIRAATSCGPLPSTPPCTNTGQGK